MRLSQRDLFSSQCRRDGRRNNPLFIFIHIPRPFVFGYYYYYYFQVKYADMDVREYTNARVPPGEQGRWRGEKTYDFFLPRQTPNNSIVILRPDDFFISENFRTTIVPNYY